MKKFLSLSMFAARLCADETINEITAKEGQTYNYWGDFVNMLVTLAFVLILIVVTVWLLKKIMRSRIKTLNRSNGIKIIERRPLSPKASLYLIDVLGKGILISESQGGVQLITTFADQVNIEEHLERLQEESKPRLSFRDMFVKKVKNRSLKQEV
jgi:flagellar biosynthetic protein FliO